ncbi:MAG: DUF1570 domain-containing protein [Pirellulaceae bacterium]|nr:DUF1570 domain-containing protein [Pirellulaceae bacterium]
MIFRRSILTVFRFGSFLLLFGGVAISSVPAEERQFPQATPEELGLLLPSAPARPGDGRRVIVNHKDALVVGIVHVEVGNRFVVLLPNGQLISAKSDEVTPTERPFVAATKAEIAHELTTGRFQGFRTRTTKRYIYVYNTSDAFATATSRIMETMYPGLFNYFRRQRIPVEDPRFPLVVVMFRTQDEFEKYRSMPPGLVAYYNGLSNHVVMYEQSRLTEIAPELAFKQSISTIAHEGVHQILHNIGVQQRLSRWPLWFSEGLAEYFAPTDLRKRVRWKGVGLVNDLRLHELSEHFKANRGKPTSGQLIRKTVEATSLDSLGYATSWALVNYLAKHERANFYAYLRRVSKIGPLETAQPGSLFTEFFGSDYLKLENEVFKHLRTLPYVDPIANQTHYALLIFGKKRQLMITSSPQQLQLYKRQQAKGKQFQIKAFPNRSTAQQVGRRWLQGR